VVPDDVFFVHRGGVDSIQTIELSGDIRAVNQTDQISRTIHQYFSLDAIAGYEPIFGTYVLKLDGYDYLVAVHTRLKAARAQGQKQISYSPVTRWKFAFSGTVTGFGNGGDSDGNAYLYVGTDDGKGYRIDGEQVQDDGEWPDFKFRTNFLTTKFGELEAEKINFNCFSRFGGTFNLKFYVNHDRVAFDTLAISTPWDTSLLPSELTMPVSAMSFLVEPGAYYDREGLNFNFRSIMIGIEDIRPAGQAFSFGPLTLMARQIGGF